MEQGVTESKEGIMSEAEGQKPPTEEGKTPEDASKVSPEDTPKYSQKAYDDAIHATKSEVGRTLKELEAREQAVKDAEAQEADRQKERDAKEIADAGDDSEKLSAIEIKQRLRTREAEISRREKEEDAREAKNKIEIQQSQSTKLETDIWEIATKQKVDPAWLKKLAVKYSISDLKGLEEIAKGASEKKPFNPDSTRHSGGSSDADFKKDFASGKLPMSKENVDRYNKMVQTY